MSMDAIPRLEQSTFEGRKSLLANVLGAYESMLCRWYVLLFVIPPILLPIVIMPIMIYDTDCIVEIMENKGH
jgi:hypothetical protein